MTGWHHCHPREFNDENGFVGGPNMGQYVLSAKILKYFFLNVTFFRTYPDGWDNVVLG